MKSKKINGLEDFMADFSNLEDFGVEEFDPQEKTGVYTQNFCMPKGRKIRVSYLDTHIYRNVLSISYIITKGVSEKSLKFRLTPMDKTYEPFHVNLNGKVVELNDSQRDFVKKYVKKIVNELKFEDWYHQVIE